MWDNLFLIKFFWLMICKEVLILLHTHCHWHSMIKIILQLKCLLKVCLTLNKMLYQLSTTARLYEYQFISSWLTFSALCTQLQLLCTSLNLLSCSTRKPKTNDISGHNIWFSNSEKSLEHLQHFDHQLCARLAVNLKFVLYVTGSIIPSSIKTAVAQCQGRRQLHLPCLSW